MVTPSGGVKDTAPPKVLESFPKNDAVNFQGNKIVVHFDEFFVLTNPAKEVFITPSLPHLPKVQVKKKELVITFNDSLAANTTYTIHFGDAIADLNEGNKLRDFQFVFSTGSFIDSMRIQGTVSDAFTATSRKDILVMLYNSFDDSVVAKQKPVYYARTDANGNFSINHIRQANYKLFALNDKDGNMLYNLPDEEIAFSDSIISVQDSVSFFALKLFKPVAEKQKLLSATCISPGKVQLAFAKPLTNFSAKVEGDSVQPVFYNSKHDTAFYFSTQLKVDSLKMFWNDSNWKDTITVTMKNVSKDTSLLKKAEQLNYTCNLSSEKGEKILPFGKPIVFIFEQPIESFMGAYVLFSDTNIFSGKEMPLEVFKDSITQKTKAVFNTKDLLPEHHYSILLHPHIFRNYFDVDNVMSFYEFTTGKKETTGNLNLKITIADSSANYLFRFFLKDGTMEQEQYLNSGTNYFKFENMEPGNYRAIIINDANYNKQWDSGNYWQHKQPEKIVLQKNDIVVRSDWDMDLELVVGGKGLKKK